LFVKLPSCIVIPEQPMKIAMIVEGKLENGASQTWGEHQGVKPVNSVKTNAQALRLCAMCTAARIGITPPSTAIRRTCKVYQSKPSQRLYFV
jgi:hypothetical protein